jgi:hypothetical protein
MPGSNTAPRYPTIQAPVGNIYPTYPAPVGSITPRVTQTYRSGDYIITQYNNGATVRTYSPLNQSRSATSISSAFGGGSNTAKRQAEMGGLSGSGNTSSRYQDAYGNMTGGGGSVATPTGSGSGGGQGSGSAGRTPGTTYDSTGLNDSDVGKLFGWTKDMTETDVIRGLEYPMRILQQITGGGQANNPGFQGFMSPIVEAASNPNTQLLFNPELGGQNTTTGSEGYNFIADLVKGYMTPGGALPDVGSALSRIASALGNSESGIYNLLMQGASGAGSSGDMSGMGAYGAMFDALSSMIAPILNLGASPLQSMITNSSMNNLMNNYMMNVGDKSENPLAYVLRGLGYNTNIANMPALGQGAAAANANNPNSWALQGTHGAM